MSCYTIREAKIHFSRLIEEASNGKEVVITRGPDKKPVAKILPLRSAAIKRRRPGSFAGKITADPVAFEPLSSEDAKVWEIEQHKTPR